MDSPDVPSFTVRFTRKYDTVLRMIASVVHVENHVARDRGRERRAGREKDPNVHDPACAWRRRQRAAERRLSPTISTIHAPNNSMKSGCAPGREIAPKEREGGVGGRREGESNIALNGPADSARKREYSHSLIPVTVTPRNSSIRNP